VVKEICSWLPPGLDRWNVCSQEHVFGLPIEGNTTGFADILLRQKLESLGYRMMLFP